MNPTVWARIHYKVGSIWVIHGWFSIRICISIVHHIKISIEKNTWDDTENVFDIVHSYLKWIFKCKFKHKLGIKWSFYSVLKVIYHNLRANVTFNGETQMFSL